MRNEEARKKLGHKKRYAITVRMEVYAANKEDAEYVNADIEDSDQFSVISSDILMVCGRD